MFWTVSPKCCMPCSLLPRAASLRAAAPAGPGLCALAIDLNVAEPANPAIIAAPVLLRKARRCRSVAWTFRCSCIGFSFFAIAKISERRLGLSLTSLPHAMALVQLRIPFKLRHDSYRSFPNNVQHKFGLGQHRDMRDAQACGLGLGSRQHLLYIFEGKTGGCSWHISCSCSAQREWLSRSTGSVVELWEVERLHPRLAGPREARSTRGRSIATFCYAAASARRITQFPAT